MGIFKYFYKRKLNVYLSHKERKLENKYHDFQIKADMYTDINLKNKLKNKSNEYNYAYLTIREIRKLIFNNDVERKVSWREEYKED